MDDFVTLNTIQEYWEDLPAEVLVALAEDLNYIA